MTLLKIREYPDPILRRETKQITVFDEKLQKLAADMADTMFDAPGVGLAAPQIGEALKFIVVDTARQTGKEKSYLAMVNPVITHAEGKQVDEEGCLSVPELTSNVQRFKKITVSYQDLQGNPQEMTVEDRFAVVLQHEIDHINGILFLDHLSSLKRALYKKKVRKWLSQE